MLSKRSTLNNWVPLESRVHRRLFACLLTLTLTAIAAILYSPTLSSYFSADDFSFLRYLYFNSEQVLSGERLYEWLVGGIVNYTVFRPTAHAYWLLDYVAFGLEPLGYHVAAILLHVAASIASFVLAYLLTRRHLTATIAAVVFVVMPVHAEAVSWLAANYDVICAIYLFLSLSFYILYRRRGAFQFYVVALGAFLLALGSREMAIVVPALLVAYDLSYHSRDFARPLRVLFGYVPFVLAVTSRMVFGGHGYRGLLIAPEGWQYYVDFNLLRAFDPLFEHPGDVRYIAIICALALLFVYRFQPAVLFGLAWVPIAIIPTLVGGVNDRSFYIPSFGIALLMAVVAASLISHKSKWVAPPGLAALIVVLIGYSAALYARNQPYARASSVAKSIVDKVSELHPTVPHDARLVFVGVPEAVPEGPPVFGVGLREALTIRYRIEGLQVMRLSEFPLWLDDLDHTFFFQVDHRNVVERADLVAALEARKRCSDFAQPAIEWDLAKDPQGWEPWNNLEDFVNRGGALAMRSIGSDPSIGSPEIDIPSLWIGDVEVEMQVQGGPPTFAGEVFWLATGQQDFSPALNQPFTGRSDGQYHTYHIELGNSGKLRLGEHITRLRLDPTAGPAVIALRSIRINVHCAPSGMAQCACTPQSIGK